MKMGEIDAMIWSEFSEGTPAERAANKLFKTGLTEKTISELNRKTILPPWIWNDVMNHLRDLEHNFPTQGEKP